MNEDEKLLSSTSVEIVLFKANPEPALPVVYSSVELSFFDTDEFISASLLEPSKDKLTVLSRPVELALPEDLLSDEPLVSVNELDKFSVVTDIPLDWSRESDIFDVNEPVGRYLDTAVTDVPELEEVLTDELNDDELVTDIEDVEPEVTEILFVAPFSAWAYSGKTGATWPKHLPGINNIPMRNTNWYINNNPLLI